MLNRSVDLGELEIQLSETESSVLDFTGWRGGADGIAIYGPGTLTGSVKVQVSLDNSTWFDKQSSGADITIPGDGSVTIKTVDWRYLRVVSDTTEAAKRVFKVIGLEDW